MIRALSPVARPMGVTLAVALVWLLVLPFAALMISASPAELRVGLGDPMFAPALRLSLTTTSLSLAITLVSGTPLAWWLATSSSRLTRAVELLVELPIVMPPAVVGIALLETFGRGGVLGPWFEALGISIPFTTTAVVLAQLVVSTPFYVQAASNAFRKVDPNLLIVARTLGANPTGAFVRVAVPVALPGLAVGASLCWARSLGEFGATLLFAGNMAGQTQTMPLAILSALESDVRVAVVFALILATVGAALLVALRLIATTWVARGHRR